MSLLPESLRDALAALAEGRGRKGLAERSQAITAGYRSRRGSDGTIATEEDALAYALARMPATFAAAEAVFERLVESIPGFAPDSLLDVGCGPGTVSFAAVRAFPSLRSLMLSTGTRRSSRWRGSSRPRRCRNRGRSCSAPTSSRPPCPPQTS